MLKKIYFNFSDDPSLGVLEDLADKYTNRKINYKILSNLQRNATIVLTKVGYNSSKAKISYLNEAKGIARITINWGRIDRVLVNNKPINTASERFMIYTALPKLVMGTSYKKKFPGIKYKVLGVIQNTDELAFTLKNLQKSGKTVKLDQGKSHLAAYGFNSLNVLYKKRYMPSLSFSVSDSGDNVDVGRLSNNIGLSFGDLLFINDIVSISRNNKIYNSGSQTSDVSDTIKYSMIFGYWDFNLDRTSSSYQTLVNGSAGAYFNKGGSLKYKLNSSYAFYDKNNVSITGYGKLNLSDSKNFVANTLVEVSSKKYTTYSLGSKISFSLLGGSFFNDISYEQGLKAFGGSVTRLDPFAPDKMHIKAGGSMSYSRGIFGGANYSLSFSTNLTWQGSNDLMLNTYRISLGGSAYSVRGYTNTEYGDLGFYVVNNLNFNILNGFFKAKKLAANIKLFLGYDNGYIRSNALTSRGAKVPPVSMTSYSYGAAISYKSGSLTITKALPADYTANVQNVNKTGVTYLNFSLNL